MDYYGTAGVQHIALNTSDIIAAVSWDARSGNAVISDAGLISWLAKDKQF
jgi:4-hydroxyphenylpyruvate dioxygenase-like putative hemolysin